MTEKEVSHLLPKDFVKRPSKRIKNAVFDLAEIAREDAKKRLSKFTSDKVVRVDNSIDLLFKPYILEELVITEQLNTGEYMSHAASITKFLGTTVAIDVCPDERIAKIALGDPRVLKLYRDPQGLPKVRPSTVGDSNKMVLNNPYVSAAIKTDIRREKAKNPNATLKHVQFVGPHINSGSPYKHGCAGKTEFLRDQGLYPDITMIYGGLETYFEELGDGFYAFSNSVGGCTTIDLVHDAYSQGFIIGLREGYKKFDHSKNLRENLEMLHENKAIIMTEKLEFSEAIWAGAKEKGVESKIDINNYFNFAQNAILIGEIAKKITIQQEEKDNFSFIPSPIRENYKDETVLRVLAYHIIRNVVYRTLAEIKPGEHNLQHHIGKLVKASPVDTIHVENLAFEKSTIPGEYQESDIKDLKKLHDFSIDSLKTQGYDITKIARCIMVAETFNPNRYVNTEEAMGEEEFKSDTVRNNAAWIRERFHKPVKDGQTVVIGALYNPATRMLTHIVKS